MKYRKMVKEVTPETMDGDTDLEKHLNAYLTCQFIVSFNMPSDECLHEAKEVIAIVRKFDARKTD